MPNIGRCPLRCPLCRRATVEIMSAHAAAIESPTQKAFDPIPDAPSSPRGGDRFDGTRPTDPACEVGSYIRHRATALSVRSAPRGWHRRGLGPSPSRRVNDSVRHPAYARTESLARRVGGRRSAEARITRTRSGECRVSEDDAEGEDDCRKLHGGIPQTSGRDTSERSDFLRPSVLPA